MCVESVDEYMPGLPTYFIDYTKCCILCHLLVGVTQCYIFFTLFIVIFFPRVKMLVFYNV